MSGSSVLRALKKADLVEAAQASSLPNYSGLKVDDLRANLDTHLKANATTYGGSSNEHLKAYYEKAGGAPKSPFKKIAEKVSDSLVKSDDDAVPAPVIKKRRKTTTAPAEESALVRAPAQDLRVADRRTSIVGEAQELVVSSPARIVAVVDSVSQSALSKFSTYYEKAKIRENLDYLRDAFSSPTAIAFLAIAFEAYGLRQKLVPFKHATDVPLTRGKTSPVYVPDLFVLLTQEFWAPFSLWLATSAVIPLLAAYFINIPLKASSSHSYGTRRATAAAKAEEPVDLFVYFIAKALISWLVYSEHFLLFNSVTNFTVAEINQNLYGKYEGILITSAIGAAISLYQAVLSK